jgi:tryptophan halogenase
MAAATLVKKFPNKIITLVESPNIPTVGVGESTLGFIRDWTNYLGLDDKDFLKHTNGTYKLSIKFTDFYEKDSGGFHYPFGDPVESQNFNFNDWLLKKVYYPDTPSSDFVNNFWPIMALVNENKISTNADGKLDSFRFDYNTAFHFDAALFGKYLKDRYCIPRGLNHIVGTVNKILTDDSGISKIILADGKELQADLYVDCTGFSSLLLNGALKEPFVSYKHILPNNKAWAVQVPYTDKEKELEVYTNCTALSNGWVWNIPLWSRIGTGYVYSDEFISDKDALQEFKNHLNSDKMKVHNPNRVTEDLKFKNIEFKTGIYERTWVKNVLAIGLSAAFIEPLESNGLLSVHEFMLEFCRHVDRPVINQWDRDVYNARIQTFYKGFAEFVALHYALTIRNDSNYWNKNRERTYDPNLSNSVGGFNDLYRKKTEHHAHSGRAGIVCIANGMNYKVYNDIDVSARQLGTGVDLKEKCNNFLYERREKINQWKSAVQNQLSAYQWLKQNIYNDGDKNSYE